MSIARFARGALAALALTSFGGGLAGCEDRDRGQCGVEDGPGETSEVLVNVIGADGAAPTVEVSAYGELECLRYRDERTWVGWHDGAITVRRPGREEKLDREVPEPQGDFTYRFEDAGVTLGLEVHEPAVRVTFVPDAGATATVRCALVDGDDVACEEL